ncbi:MAG: respiratory chain complex I subunit 1 family protein [Thermacetogeniaceae bacterium]
MPKFDFFIVGLLQAVAVLILAPLYAGFSRFLRAKMHSRQGPPLFQYYHDIFKLMKRQEVRPAYATWVFRSTPYVMVASGLLAAMMVPMGTAWSPLGYAGDAIAVIYLLAVNKFFLALSGLDSGSGFAGAGSIREMGISALVEPTIMLVLFVVALFAHSTNLGTISQKILSGSVPYTSPAFWLGIAAFALASFIEMGKLPFDLSEAEQEIQEGPFSEYSGPSLALAKWGLFIKQFVVASLFLALFFPFGSAPGSETTSILLGFALFLLKLALLYAIAAVFENTMARLIFYKTPQITWTGFGLALLSLVFYLVQVMSEVRI